MDKIEEQIKPESIDEHIAECKKSDVFKQRYGDYYNHLDKLLFKLYILEDKVYYTPSTLSGLSGKVPFLLSLQQQEDYHYFHNGRPSKIK